MRGPERVEPENARLREAIRAFLAVFDQHAVHSHDTLTKEANKFRAALRANAMNQ